MNPSQLFFCNECGAANSELATHCVFCQQALSLSPSAPPSLEQAGAIIPFNQPQLQLATSSLLAERYHIISEAGQGGFGVVYKARDTKRHNQLVAVTCHSYIEYA